MFWLPGKRSVLTRHPKRISYWTGGIETLFHHSCCEGKKTLSKRQIRADTVALKPAAVVQNSEKNKKCFCLFWKSKNTMFYRKYMGLRSSIMY